MRGRGEGRWIREEKKLRGSEVLKASRGEVECSGVEQSGGEWSGVEGSEWR